MLRIFLLITVSLSFYQAIVAQVQYLDKGLIQLNFQIDLLKGEFVHHSDPNFTTNFFSDGSVQLIDNELLIGFNVARLDDKEHYVVSIAEIRFDDKIIQPSPVNLLKDIGRVEPGREDLMVIWTNLIEELPRTKGSLEIVVEVEWWGATRPYDCDHPPVFDYKQKRYYYAAAIVGAGSIATGFLLRQKAQKHFDKHRNANTLSELNAEYDKYAEQLDRAKIVSYIGVGMLVADAILFYARTEKHRKRLEIFDKYCKTRDLTIVPYWDTQHFDNTQSVGLYLNYQF